MDTPEIVQLRSLLTSSERIVAFTGAGISTDSGIPDFRSPGGFWENNRPIDFSEFLQSEDARREAWRRKTAFAEAYAGVEPNEGHRALHRLHEQGRLHALITQNIDGLHQASGVPDDRVIELHGNGTYAKCLQCAKRFELEPLLRAFSEDDTPPRCDSCGGIVKSATISFGQAMPEDEMARAEAACAACDLCLVLGTSLVVYPAAGFPRFAKMQGARLAIVNRDPTEQDQLADVVVHEDISQVLKAAVPDVS